MVAHSFISILFLLSSTFAQSQVIQLTSNNISQYLQDHVTFVKFYSNWCPHSKKFEPVWKQFADTKQNSDVHVAKVDCSSDGLLCSDHDVFGYPTVKLFVRGSGARYEGPREITSLEAFYREKFAEDVNLEDTVATKTPVVELTTETFPSLTKQGFAFVVFFAPWCTHCQVLKPIFQELAKQLIHVNGLICATVDCTTQSSLCSKHAIKGYPTLIWFENGAEKDRYVRSRDVSTMRTYVEQKMEEGKPIVPEPVLVEQPSETIDNPLQFETLLTVKTFTKGISFEGYAFVNFGAAWCSHCQKLIPIWNQLAQRFAAYDEIRIVRVDCTASEPLCRDYGIRAFPTLILFRYGESQVEYNGSRDLNSLYNFLVNQLELFGDEYLLNQQDDGRKND